MFWMVSKAASYVLSTGGSSNMISTPSPWSRIPAEAAPRTQHQSTTRCRRFKCARSATYRGTSCPGSSAITSSQRLPAETHRHEGEASLKKQKQNNSRRWRRNELGWQRKRTFDSLMRPDMCSIWKEKGRFRWTQEQTAESTRRSKIEPQTNTSALSGLTDSLLPFRPIKAVLPLRSLHCIEFPWVPGLWRRAQWLGWGSVPAGCRTAWPGACWWLGRPSALLCTLWGPAADSTAHSEALCCSELLHTGCSTTLLYVWVQFSTINFVYLKI